MSYVSTAEPIKIGYLMDFRLPPDYPQTMRDDLTKPFELVFAEALAAEDHRPADRDRLPRGRGPPEGIRQGGDRRLRRARRRGLPPRLRPEHHRQRRADARGDRGALPRPGDQRDRHRGLAGRVDVLVSDGLDDRRADLLGGPARQAWVHARSACWSSSRWSARATSRNFRRACKRKDIRIVAEASIAQTAQDVGDGSPQPARGQGRRDRALRLRLRRGPGEPASSQALGWDPPRFTGTAFQNAWLHPIMWNALLGWTGIDQYDESEPRRPAFPGPVRGGVRPTPRVLRPGRQPRHRGDAPPRPGRRPSAEPPRREGGARAGEDASRRVRRSGDPDLAREVEAPSVGRRRLPRRPEAGPGRDPLSPRRSLR